MDHRQHQFDALARALARLIDRRQGLGGALALLAVILVAGEEVAAKKGKGTHKGKGKGKHKKKKRRRKNKKRKRKKRKNRGVPRDCHSIPLKAGADVHECDLRQHPGLASADFTNARLEDTNLSGVNLSGVSFRGAWLWRANLQNANLSNADFTDSSEKRTDIFAVDFSGATLDGAAGIEDALYHHYARF